MYTTIFLFILGFVFLIKGADILVEGSSSIAKKFGISNLVIGLTIVAFGTSTPELFVNTIASFKGSSGIALGNIIGSNTTNALLGLGLAAVIAPLTVKRSTVYKEIPFFILSILAVGALINDRLIDGSSLNLLTRIDGFVLILFFSIFIYYTFGISKSKEGTLEHLTPGVLKKDEMKRFSSILSFFMIIGGIISLYIGGQFIVSGALSFSEMFGLSETFIGLTLVAIGTSLPEITASAVAAKKGNYDIAVGNIIGTNIFNILWVLGLSSMINPISYDSSLNLDMLIMLFSTILVLFTVYHGKKNTIGRLEGASLLGVYSFYLIFLIIRG